MSEDPQAGGEAGAVNPLGRLRWALWGAALIGVAVVVYIIAQSSSNPTPTLPPAPVISEKPLHEKLTFPSRPTPAPDYVFYDEAGKALRVADFKGKVVVLNIWATWCAPCVTEMPTLAKLQAVYADQQVEVVAVSIDTPSAAAKARLFIASQTPLKFYVDREMKLPFKTSPPIAGTPATMIYDANGLETARVSGPTDWTKPEARALVDKALAGG
jgi:thiol-disulfide isomerase/thioredoxin